MLPIVGIPGPDGQGDLGPGARRFVDWLVDSGQAEWHVPVHHGASSTEGYAPPATSANAGDPMLISLDDLVELGVLPDTIDSLRAAAASDRAARPGIVSSASTTWKWHLLQHAARQLLQRPPSDDLTRAYLGFCSREAHWLADHVAFTALRAAIGDAPRHAWPANARVRRLGAHRARSLNIGATHAHPEAALQFLYDLQAARLHRYASKRGIRLVAHVSLYVADDSADVWARPELFHLDRDHQPLSLVGRPPTPDNPAGEVWYAPGHEWSQHHADEYQWWTSRLTRVLHHADAVHIKDGGGIVAWWSVPPRAAFGEQGTWEAGPGAPLLDALRSAAGPGRLTVDEAPAPPGQHPLDVLDVPPVRVLMSGLDEGAASSHLPASWRGDELVFTHRHAEPTIAGWAAAAAAGNEHRAHERLQFALQHTGARNVFELPRYAIALLLQSAAGTAIVPLQDWLGVDDGVRRIGTRAPRATASWTASGTALDDELAADIRALTDRAERTTTKVRIA